MTGNNPLSNWLDKHKFYQHSEYAGYSTKELAAHLGVSVRTIQRWIKGVGKPNDYQSSRIEEFLSKG